MTESISIFLNGIERSFEHEISVAALVESLGLRADRVAFERNGEIVPRDQWIGTMLKAGDRAELVHFVGGGNQSEPAVPTTFP